MAEEVPFGPEPAAPAIRRSWPTIREIVAVRAATKKMCLMVNPPLGRLPLGQETLQGEGLKCFLPPEDSLYFTIEKASKNINPVKTVNLRYSNHLNEWQGNELIEIEDGNNEG
ncbi:MAG: hypothetical protein E6K56_08620 [Ignavibacteria bacterium]|nr:MAG: hypothetical protein E6K56_08620 [Ignavibacteria bacterium]